MRKHYVGFAVRRRMVTLSVAAVALIGVGAQGAGAQASPPPASKVVRLSTPELPAFGPQQLAHRTGQSLNALAGRAHLSRAQLTKFVYGAQLVAGMTPNQIVDMVLHRPELILGTPVEESLDIYVGFGRDPKVIGDAIKSDNRLTSAERRRFRRDAATARRRAKDRDLPSIATPPALSDLPTQAPGTPAGTIPAVPTPSVPALPSVPVARAAASCDGTDTAGSTTCQYENLLYGLTGPARTVNIFCQVQQTCDAYVQLRSALDKSDGSEAELLGNVDTKVYSYPSSTFHGGSNCDQSHDLKRTKNPIGKTLVFSRTDVDFCYTDPTAVTRSNLYNEEHEPTTGGSLLGWDYDKRTFRDTSCYNWFLNYSCSGKREFATYKFKRCIGPFGVGCIQSSYHRHKHFLHANGASYTDVDR